MKILISYYYNIRFLPQNCIPVSTSMGDPCYYHPIPKDKTSQGFDKRHIWLGIRYEKFNPSLVYCSDGGCMRCNHTRSESCDFLKNYKAYLDSLDYNAVMQDLERLKAWASASLKIENPIIVLMVHEADNNPCSEREPLIQWFKDHNYILERFDKNCIYY